MDWPGWDKIAQEAVKDALDTVTMEVNGRVMSFLEFAAEVGKGNIVEVVRCRDCKHKRRGACSLTLEGQYNGDEWFCADGERRQEHGEAGEQLEGDASASK